MKKRLSAVLFGLIFFSLGHCAAPAPRQAPPRPSPEKATRGSGYLGILYTPRPEGLMILRVFPDSPADKAGLRAGDIMVAANNLLLNRHSLRDFKNMILDMRPGAVLELHIERRGRQLSRSAIIGRRDPTKFPLRHGSLRDDAFRP